MFEVTVACQQNKAGYSGNGGDPKIVLSHNNGRWLVSVTQEIRFRVRLDYVVAVNTDGSKF